MLDVSIFPVQPTRYVELVDGLINGFSVNENGLDLNSYVQQKALQNACTIPKGVSIPIVSTKSQAYSGAVTELILNDIKYASAFGTVVIGVIEYTPDEAEVVNPKFKSREDLGVTKHDVEPGLTG